MKLTFVILIHCLPELINYSIICSKFLNLDTMVIYKRKNTIIYNK